MRPGSASGTSCSAPETFKAWTAEFAEGSYFEGSWNAGRKIRFLVPDGSGMTSTIAESRPHEFISIKHLGIVANSARRPAPRNPPLLPDEMAKRRSVTMRARANKKARLCRASHIKLPAVQKWNTAPSEYRSRSTSL